MNPPLVKSLLALIPSLFARPMKVSSPSPTQQTLPKSHSLAWERGLHPRAKRRVSRFLHTHRRSAVNRRVRWQRTIGQVTPCPHPVTTWLIDNSIITLSHSAYPAKNLLPRVGEGRGSLHLPHTFGVRVKPIDAFSLTSNSANDLIDFQ